MDDKQGKWVTINGTHIFIKDGQTVEEAIEELNTKRDNNIKTILGKIKYADAKYWYVDRDTKERIMPKKHFTKVFGDALKVCPIVKSDIEDCIVGCIQTKLKFLQLQDHGISDYDSGWERIRLNVVDDSVNSRIVEVFCHEMGHAMDNISGNKWRSSSFVSSKHGVTMVSMLFDELKNDENLESLCDEYEILQDLKRQVVQNYKDKSIDRQEYYDKYTAYDEARVDLADVVQAIWGNEECKRRFGFIPHPKPPDYFYGERGRRYAGTECFAELTANLSTDNEKRFYDIMKTYAPKTIEIYEEIMEEVKDEYGKVA